MIEFILKPSIFVVFCGPDDMKKLENFRDLLFEKKAFVQIAIVRGNGKPHVTPNWFNMDQNDFESGIIKINTATGRIKALNIKKGSYIAMNIIDPDNSYRYLGIEGEVIDTIMGKEANDHIDDLMFKYHGKRPYAYHREGEERIKILIRITKVISH